MAAFTFTDQTAIIGTISNVVDASGAQATFKSPPSWVSSDPTIFNPTVAADGLSCTGTILKTGTVTVVTTGDGVSVSSTINAVAGTVVSFSVTFAPAPPPPPPGP
jgi:hypothetical protein